MNYETIKHAIFLERPNRFIAHVLIDGILETVHVKNTGRCRELLMPGVAVILEKAKNTGRKTAYSLIAVYKGNMLINIDSQAPNEVVYEALKQGLLPEFGDLTEVAKEVTYGKSRLDLYYENEFGKGFIEVKGVTLERDGMVLFPDAPTERGVKHLMELIKAVKVGYSGCIFFLIQMKGPTLFQPNSVTDPKFSAALRLAHENGVKVMAYDSEVTEDELTMGKPIRVGLQFDFL
jgi:sugar fermentation stimulation protein A